MSEARTTPDSGVRTEAEGELRECGFILGDGGDWHGTINLGAHGEVPARTHLPSEFPRALPEIFVDRSMLARRIPHVEKSGKVCIAPSTGVLLDTSAPRQLIQDALKRAREVLVEGLSGDNEEDLLEEFSAYWNADAGGLVRSICDASAESRIIQLVAMVQPIESKRYMDLAADDFDAAKTWAERAGWRISQRDEAFFIRVETAFAPPDFDKKIPTSELFEIILQAASSESNRLIKSWLRTKALPACTLISIPLAQDQGQVVIGARLEKAVGEAKQRAQKGFRPGHVPASIETQYTRETPITRLEVQRLDPNYLLGRGGGNNDLYSRTVTVVGCGAVGSHVAKHLASLGIGRIKLIDPERLTPENIHRHVLGASFIDTNKTEGMRRSLNRHYPHIAVEHRAERVEAVLDTEPGFITDVDMLVIALGDETLELYLNDVLQNRMPRLHVWVEPLSIGGHLLATGLSGGKGCFRCLFETDPVLGIHNQSAFAAPGQKFQPSYSGCAGTFTPFAGVDADRAAIEASNLASRILLKRENQNVLMSWRGYDEDFAALRFRLSERGNMLRCGETRIETHFAKSDCSCCGRISQ